MLIDFFLHLKAAKLPVSTREFLTLLEALQEDVVAHSIDDFYYLARTCLVKDEALYDRFNLAFGAYFHGLENVFDIRAGIPEEWIRKAMEGTLTEEEKAMVNCPLCDAVIDVDEEELDEGDSLICEECGANLNVSGVSPLELSPESSAEDDDPEEDDFEDDDDPDEDQDEEEDDEDEEDWK